MRTKSHHVSRYLLKLMLLVPMGIYAQTPTDEELKALERQIEQQEAAQMDAKRRAAEEAQREAEEQKLRDERARLEEERRKLAEEKEAARKQAETEKKRLYDQYMNEAEKSMTAMDFELADKNYRKALEIFHNDAQALAGLEHIQELKNRCSSIIGEWGWDGTTQTMTFEPGGIVVHRAALNTVIKQNWECADAENYRFIMKGGGGSIDYYLSGDGNHLKGPDPWGNISPAKRKSKH